MVAEAQFTLADEETVAQPKSLFPVEEMVAVVALPATTAHLSAYPSCGRCKIAACRLRSIALLCLLFHCAQRIRYISSATPSAFWIILGPFFLFDFFSHESAGCTARVEARAVFGRLVTLPPGTSVRFQTALLHRPELQTSEEDAMWWSLYFEICATSTTTTTATGIFVLINIFSISLPFFLVLQRTTAKRKTLLYLNTTIFF